MLMIAGSLSGIGAEQALGAEYWGIKVTSNLSEIDQFENRELTFEISIRDKSVISFLNEPGTEVSAGAILAPLKNVSILPSNQKSSGIYSCYSPIPTALAGNTGGSALRMEKSGDQNLVTLKYRCWFPIGMKAGVYSLNIKASVMKNNGCCSMPNPSSWDNSQVFLFGDIDESLRPSWYYETGLRQGPAIAPYTTIQRIINVPSVTIVRRTSKTSPENLTFNAKNLQESTSKMREYTTKESEKTSELINLIETSNSKNNEYFNMLDELTKKNKDPKNLNEISSLRSSLVKISEDLAEINKEVNLLPLGNLENNLRLRYLYGLDFDVVSKPEVLIAQIPNFKNLAVTPTPYLRFVIKSKTSIINSNIHLGSPSTGGPIFQNNVITPGTLPINDQRGGGLALVENQQWDGSLFLTSILVGPKYTPLSSENLSWMRTANSICGKFTDAAGNSTDEWNLKGTEYCGDLPMATQAESAAGDFDNLIKIYDELGRANSQLEQSRFLSPELNSKLLNYRLLPEQMKALGDQINLLTKKVTLEQNKSSTKNVTCVKGKIVKKIPAKGVKCPAGYTRK